MAGQAPGASQNDERRHRSREIKVGDHARQIAPLLDALRAHRSILSAPDVGLFAGYYVPAGATTMAGSLDASSPRRPPTTTSRAPARPTSPPGANEPAHGSSSTGTAR